MNTPERVGGLLMLERVKGAGPEQATHCYIMLMLAVFPLFTGFSGYANITFSKYIFFVAATALWLAASLALSLRGKRAPERPKAWTLPVLGFMAVCTVSALVSEFFPATIIGAARYDGLVTQLLYALICLGVARWGRVREIYVHALGFSVTLCCIAAVFQLLGCNFLWLFPDGLSFYDGNIRYSGVFLGTLGNVDVLCSLLCLAIPAFFACVTVYGGARLGLPLFLSVFILAESGVAAGAAALAAAAVLGAPFLLTTPARLRRALGMSAVALLALALSAAFSGEKTEAGIAWSLVLTARALDCLAAAAALGIAALALALVRRSPSPAAMSRGVAAVCLAVLVGGTVYVYRYSGSSETLAELSRVLHGQLDGSFGSSRILIWRETLALVPEHPLLGGGPDTLSLRLDMEFSRVVEETGRTITRSVDNAHNEYLGFLVNEGLLGLLAYLGIAASALAVCFRRRKSPSALVLGVTLVSWCVQSFFSLGLCFAAPLFWLLLGLINARFRRENPMEET